MESLKSLFDSLPENIFRAKGMVKTDLGDKLIQFSPAGLDISRWEKKLEASRLVFIGKKIDSSLLEAKLKESVETV